MLTLAFDYTKADGSVSKRVITPHIMPGTMYAGTDISELSFEDRIRFASAMNKLADEHAAKLAEINAEFDLNDRYRQFLAIGVSKIQREFI